MSLKDSLSRPEPRALICTITGDPGMGKTPMAATFPKPVFIRAEDGMSSIPPDKMPFAFPVLESFDMIMSQMNDLLNDQHSFKTLVIDTVSQLDVLFTEEILRKDKEETLAKACGGYGAGSQKLASMHGSVRKMVKHLNERRKMNVVFIAHSDVKAVNPPDGDPYDRYSVKMTKGSESFYINDVDMVAHIRYEIFMRGKGENKKVVSNGDRVVVAHSHPTLISKNRFGISEPIKVVNGINPFDGIIPSLTAQKPKEEK